MKRVYLFSLCLLVATMVAAYSGLVGDFSLDSLKEVIAPQAVEKVAEEAKKPEPDANLEFQDFTLRIIHNNDGESRIVSETIDGKVVGGAAEFKTAVDSLKATGVSNITLSSGDNFLAGKNFAASLNRADGLPFYDVEVLEAIGYDAICIGNHDFDFGPDVLADFINDFTVNTPPYLSANLDFSGEANLQTLVDADRIAPRTIVDVDGEQVGVIGLITESIGNISSPGNVQVDFTLVATAQAQIDSLTNAGVNKIILITHLQSIENELDLIAQIQGVDVVIAGGGDELLTNDPSIALDDQSVFGEYPLPATDVNGDTVYVVTTPGNYRYVGNLTVHFDDAGNVTEIVDGSDLILIEGFAADSALQASVTDSIVAANAALASNIIATSEVDLDGVRGNVRTIETNQGNLITDAFLWLAERERDARGLDPNLPIVSMQGGGGIRNDNVIPAGDFSEVFTFDMLPFSNTVVVLDPITPTQFKTVLENSVSSIPGASGRFSQVAGCEIVYNPFGDPQTTNEQDEIVLFDGDRIISATLADGTEIIKDGEVVDGAPNIYIVTNSFTAAGGDEYYVFDGLTSTQIAPSYQRALFDFIVDPTGLNGVITAAQYPEGGESRIAKESIVIEDSDKTFDLFPIGTFQTGIFDESAAEIVAYDAGSQRAFFTNADKNSVSIISISNPTKPRQIADIDMSVYGAGVNSVAVYDGLVAVAVEAEAVDANGSVVFFDTDGAYINDVEAGVLPDMLIFTPDGTRVLTANEGQPDDDYTIDPEGSVSIIDVANGADSAKVVNINFQSLNGTEDSLRAQGIRIFGPGASAAQDFEPEYVTITEDGSTAYVILQENNAIAVIDLETSTLSGVVPLGFKDHSADGNGFDASNRSELIDIRPRPTFGMYQPDAIKSVNINGMDYIVSANEGDSRDYDGFSEEERVGGITLDPTAFPDAANLQLDSVLGRLNITTSLGDTDGDGDFDELYSYGARSFSIWGADGSLIFDSGNHLEQKIAELDPDNFNSNNDDNDSRKARSDDKGPEPEAVEIVKLDGSVFALIGLERMSGIMIYDITDPTAPTFVNYVNNRDFGVDAETPEAGDLGVEDLKLIPAEDSPVGIPLVLSANEVSGTVTIFAVNEIPVIADEFTLRVVHNNDGESRLLPDTLGNRIIGGASQFKTVVDELRGFNTPSITLSSGDNFLAGINFTASLTRADGLPFYDAQVLDAIGYDAIAIGNHDFDFGPDVLAEFIQGFSATMPPYLSANLDFSGEANLQALVDAGRIAPRTIIDVDGEQIGVVGLITESINNISSPRNVVVDFDLVGVAQAQIDSLEAAGVNKIILITHLQDITNEIDLIAQIQGVDVVIAGGGDELLTNTSANILDDEEIFDSYPLRTPDLNGDTVYVVTTPGNYRYVGNLVLNFDDMGNIVSVGNESDLILVENAATDAALDTTVIDSILANQLALRSNIIATSEVDLDGVRGNVRTIETNQGNMITDAFLWLAERDRAAVGLDANLPIVAMQGGGGIRNDNVIPAGAINEAQTFDMLPFSNSVVVLDPVTPEQFKTVLENSVSSVPGASGRFSQIAGFEFVYDPLADPQTTDEEAETVTFDGARIISATLADGTVIIENGEVVDGAPNIYIATNSFQAGGGDEYYLFGNLSNTFIAPSYQRALFDYIIDPNGLNGLITAAQYPEGGEGRIRTRAVVVEDSDKTFDLFPIGTFQTGIFDESAAEIVAYDAGSQRAFFTNADKNSVSIISISNPTKPRQIADIDMSVYGAGVNSVAVYDGLVAVAVEAEAVDANGSVVFFDTDGAYINDVEAGVLPDMLTFTPDGTRVLTANEGQPDDDYTIDPEGSVSIINVENGAENAQVINVNFQSLNGTEVAMRAQGIRIFGPGASAAQDLEPEYVTITEDGSTAYVILQENNAIAVIDIETATLNGVVPLGFKDHSLAGNGFDASNRSELIDIRPRPTFGMYQPDAIKSVNINGMDYIVSANEGDSRDYDGFSEEERVGGITLDPTAFPDAANLQLDSVLGRLNITTTLGDTDGDGDFDELYSYGARSFSIWGADGSLIFDSGNHLEQKIAELDPDNFNSNNDDNDSRKARSDDKGPEPEAVEIVKLGDDVFALIGLERMSGIMVYDITDPTAPTFVNYVNNRDFGVDADTPEAGDLGVEDLKYISADDSPVGIPLVLSANEVSGTVTIFAVNEIPDVADEFTLRVVHNNDGESRLLPDTLGNRIIGGASQFKTVVDELRGFNTPSITLSSGDNFLAGINFTASLNRAEGLPFYDAQVLDAIGYDAIAIGNHDFDFGPDVLADFIQDFPMTMPPYLSANLDFSGEANLQALVDAGRIAPRTIVDVDGEQIGVVGLITESINNISSPGNVVVDFDLVGVAQAQIDSLEAAGVNKIILITHLQDITNEVDLISQIEGVDVVIAGGGDELLTNTSANLLNDDDEIFDSYPLRAPDLNGDTVFVVTTPGNYRYVGNLVLSFDEMGNVTSVGTESDLILVENAATDAALDTTVIDSILANQLALRSNIIAQSEVDLDGIRGNVRTIETNQGNLITDAFLWLAERERDNVGLDASLPIVAIQGGGGIRNDNIIPAGPISEAQTFDMLPFANSVQVLDPITPAEFKTILENSVSSVPGASGRFSQIAGFEIVYNPAGAPQTTNEEQEMVTFDGARIISATLADGTAIIENGEVVEGAPNVYVVTNSFTANGGDEYYAFDGRNTTFIAPSYQRALFDYIVDPNGLNGLITAAQYPEGGEGRIRTEVIVVEDSDKTFDLFPIGTFQTGLFDESAAEIVAYDAGSQRAFFTNANDNTVSILSISNPTKPRQIADIDMSVYGAGVNSVAVYDGLVAVAVEAEEVDTRGKVVFFDTDGVYINDVEAGFLPDMVTFTPDGTKVLTANEGQPNDDYTIDPEGSVSIINVANGAESAQAVEVSFTEFNGQEDMLRSQDIRIFGPGASAAQDFEPEYVTVTEDSRTAYVILQENNAIMAIDIETATVAALVPLGYKDHSMLGNGFDASNRSELIDIRPRPTFGMYQPDAIKTVNINGMDYVVSANEGDSRDYDGFSEEERVGGITLDPTAFPNAAELQQDSVLGRLNITTTLGDTDGDGDFDELYSYGARSFSIWAADGSLIFDSGNHMETKIAELDPDNFNSNNDDNDSRKARSDDKGPEPEAVEIVKLGDDVFALIGLERMSGIMVYDITDPTAPTFVNYVNNRDFGFDADTPEAGDLGVEDLKYISAEDSPVGIPLVLSANEVSGTVTIFAVNEVPMIADEFTLRVVHNNDGESRLLPDTLGNRIIGGASQFKTVADELRGFNTPSITLSSGDNFLAGINFSASLNRAEGLPFYDAQVLDAIGYDAIAIGNHDFDFGPDVLADFIQDFSTTMPPYLSANLDFSGEANLQALVDEGRIAPRTIINVDGEQIGVVGLITESINNISSPGNVVVDFNLVGVAQAQIDSLEAAGVNKIILITHLQDIDNEIDLISQIEGVDVVIAGGGDELLTNNSANILNDDDEIFDSYPLRTPDINGDTVYVVTTPGNYRYVGNLVLSFDEMGNVTSVGTESDLILVENAATDAALDTTVIDSILANQLALRSNIIAQSEVDLDGIRGNVRTIETNQGNLITDAFLWLAERDRDAAGLDENTPIVAIQGGGGIRNDNIIPAGPISEAQTFDMLPFANSVQVLDPITPAEFKTMLENSVSKIPGASGRFLQVAGFEMVYDTARAAQTTNEQQEVVTFDGERVVSATLADGTQIIVDGEVVDGAPNVYVVTNSFTARGGDEYYIFDGRNTTFIAPSYQRALFEYIVDELAGLITAAQYPVGGEDRIVLFDPTSTEEFDLDLSEYSFNVSPNPMSNNVQVSYELPKTSQVTITLVDLMGRPIQNIVEDQLGAGQYTHTLDGSDLPTGIYAFLIQIDGKINAMKVVKQ